jgi:hypothetical protein
MKCGNCPRIGATCMGESVPRLCQLVSEDSPRGRGYRFVVATAVPAEMIESPASSEVKPDLTSNLQWSIHDCRFAKPILYRGEPIATCKDRFCSYHDRIVCRLSDCASCPIPFQEANPDGIQP